LDLCLIGMGLWGWTFTVLEICVALGMVIFVHELGHFAVAKLCGVKCEKFYMGFDIFGLKIFKFRWGETEYGIGILPLGGYVKMLGQEDNPAKLREEMERAQKQSSGATAGLPSSAAGTGGQATHGTQSAAGATAGLPSSAGSTGGQATRGAQSASAKDAANAPAALYDPRSFLAKSVPKRMAIIAAGVVMNVIFAFLCATVAYRLSVTQIDPTVGSLMPGGPAWQVGIKPGDKIEQVGGTKISRYQDILHSVTVGEDISQGVPIIVNRGDQKERLTFTVHPTTTGMAPMIGISSSFTTTLRGIAAPADADSEASRAFAEFKTGDKIVQMDDQPIESYADIRSYLAAHRDKNITVTVERAAKDKKDKSDNSTSPEEVKVTLPPRPMSVVAEGLRMAMGPITTVQVDSPAAKADLRKGDVLLKINGEPIDDPMRLPELVRKLSLKSPGETIELAIERDGKEIKIDRVELNQSDSYEQPVLVVGNNPVDIPQLGIAYHVLNRVAAVDPDSAAAKAGLKSGDTVVKATILPPKDIDSNLPQQQEVTLNFQKNPMDWTRLTEVLQNVYPGTRVELTLEGDRQVTVEPGEAEDWFNPDRGLPLEPLQFMEKAENWGDAARLGARETWESLTMVVKFLRNLGTRISFDALGGPATIVAAAYGYAQQGPAMLLIFLTMLSANLAVLNILPIPILDGGHIMFLAYEGVRGKPANERVQILLSYIGLALILALMIWVIRLDIMRFLFPSGW
jgi:regulator of sigma E protease